MDLRSRGSASGGAIKCLLIILFVLTAANIGRSQSTIITDHFNIYYTTHAQNTARRVAEIAEEVYNPLAAAFNAFDSFSRIHIFVHDDVDFSNGFANYYENKVEIWATDLDFELRGAHNWIKNVLTHELAHIISLKVASRGFFNFGVAGAGAFNNNPDFSFQLPYYHVAVPSWYAEGVAQFATQSEGHDSWDSHRDMLLRMAVLEGDLLSYDNMGVFAGDGLHREMVYNQGFGLLNYILKTYGEGKVEALAQHTGLLSFNKAIKNVIGVSGGKLYDEWKGSLVKEYTNRAGKIAAEITVASNGNSHHSTPLNGSSASEAFTPYRKNGKALTVTPLAEQTLEGQLIIDGGYLDFFPAVSPDGKKIAYISNEGSDFALTRLHIYTRGTGHVQSYDKDVRGRLSWTPDSERLVYVRRKNQFNDLFVFDIKRKKERRISASLRAKDPAVSPDGKSIAFVRNKDGSTNLALANLDGSGVRYFSNYNDGTQIVGPVWSPDGSKIAFSIFRGEDRDIAIVRADAKTFINKIEAPDSLAFADTSAFEVLIHTTADERDPCWLPDGSGLVYSSNREGIFNLYEYSLKTGQTYKRTSVLGGAFVPKVLPDGETIIYAGYHAANYNIYQVGRKTFSKLATLEQVDRDYQEIYTGKPLRDLFTLGRARKNFTISQAIPIVNISPSFVGDRFTLNTVNIGALFSFDDILGSDRFAASAVVGKTVTSNLDLNYTLDAYYERRLPAILTENRALAPTGYLYGGKRIINDLGEFRVTQRDTFGLVVQDPGAPPDTLENAAVRIQDLAIDDKSKFDFGNWGGGFTLPISSRQRFSFQYTHRAYKWAIARKASGTDSAFIIHPDLDPEAIELSPPSTNTFTLLDAEFFTSNDFSFSWSYNRSKRTIDQQVNPTGVRGLTLRYTRLGTRVTDAIILDPFAITGPTSRADRRNLGINEYAFFWQEYIDLWGRHTLGLRTSAIYMDQRFPEEEELINIDGYFPLRLYLGGQGTLRGYPYFTLDGSKVFFQRVNYTFPILANIGKQFLNLHLTRLYGSAFFDIGAAWNFDEFAFNKLNDRWLYDAGFELRLALFSYYRIPTSAFFQVAWPLRGFENTVQRGDARIYFGFILGGIN